nr:MAG TPA: Putative cell wall binding repeat [Caudoviricetes sp.]
MLDTSDVTNLSLVVHILLIILWYYVDSEGKHTRRNP